MNGIPHLSSFLFEYESLHANKPRSTETVPIQGTSIERWNITIHQNLVQTMGTLHTVHVVRGSTSADITNITEFFVTSLPLKDKEWGIYIIEDRTHI